MHRNSIAGLSVVATQPERPDFDCAICGHESTGPAHPVRTAKMPPGLSMAACTSCAMRWGSSAIFRRDHAPAAEASAVRAFRRRVSDHLGCQPEQVFTPGGIPAAEAALGLPAGSVIAAMRAALGVQR